MPPDHCHALAFPAHQWPSRTVCATVISPRLCSSASRSQELPWRDSWAAQNAPAGTAVTAIKRLSILFIPNEIIRYSLCNHSRARGQFNGSPDHLIYCHCLPAGSSANLESRCSAEEQALAHPIYPCDTRAPTHNLTVECPTSSFHAWSDPYPLPAGTYRPQQYACCTSVVSAVSAPPPTGSCERARACISARSLRKALICTRLLLGADTAGLITLQFHAECEGMMVVVREQFAAGGAEGTETWVLSAC